MNIRVAMVTEKSGKNKNFSRSGNLQKSRKISVLVKVSEKSGNFVFTLPQGFVKIIKTFSFGKLI